MTRGIELLASALTVAGMALGSTTLPGALFYAASLVPWWWLTLRLRLWGLVPLNAAVTLVTAWNIYHAL